MKCTIVCKHGDDQSYVDVTKSAFEMIPTHASTKEIDAITKEFKKIKRKAIKRVTKK